MANSNDTSASAGRLRWATLYLTNPRDRALVSEYVLELEITAREQAEEDRRKGPK